MNKVKLRLSWDEFDFSLGQYAENSVVTDGYYSKEIFETVKFKQQIEEIQNEYNVSLRQTTERIFVEYRISSSLLDDNIENIANNIIVHMENFLSKE